MADERIPTSRDGRGACHDVRVRAIVSNEVEIDRREIREPDSLIARQRDRLEKNLRQDDGRATVEVDAVFETCDIANEILEVAQASLSEGGT